MERLKTDAPLPTTAVVMAPANEKKQKQPVHRGTAGRAAVNRRQKKSQHPSWLRNTGSNVSNVVPSQPVAVALLKTHSNNNHYHSHL